MKYILIFIIAISFWAVFVEPNMLIIRNININIPELRGLKIVFASDFHIKPYEAYRLKKIINAINAQNPDIILLGGDYVNGHKKSMSYPVSKIAYEFSKLKAKSGILAVIGNHDGWQGKAKVIKELEKNNVKVLFNNNKCFEKFCVAGVDDLQTGNPDISKALNGVKKPVILLTHTPDIMPDVPSGVDLTLAGHLHGGQIRLNGALIVPSKFGKKYANGYLDDSGRKIYTTAGLGSSILPVRLNCTPEIAVITFE